MLKSEEFHNDPRVKEAKKSIINALKEHQTKIEGVKPADPALKIHYEELLEKFNQNRGGKLYYPYLGSGFGKGSLVELLDGSVKYDFITGIGPHFYGHSHPDIMNAALDAALSDTVMQGNLQQNLDSLELTDLLIKLSGFEHCFITSSGAMANENALKIIFQKKFPKSRILAFEGCFAGRTLAVSQITDKPQFREGLPHTLNVDYIPFYSPDDPDISLRALKKALLRYPNQHAAMILELVQGEGGFNFAEKEYFQSICKFLKENDIAIFADEVQTFGRTPSLFAFQYYGLESYINVLSIGKMSQIAATFFHSDFKPKPGLLSQTFTSSTAAIKAAAVILEKLVSGGYYGEQGKIVRLHETFRKGFQEMEARHPGLIKGPYGIGVMIAFTPYNGEKEKVTAFVHKLFDAGVIAFTAGSNPVRVRLLIPPLAITDDDIKLALGIIERTLCS